MSKKNILSQALDELKEHVEWDVTKEELKEEYNDGFIPKLVGWIIIIFVVIAINFKYIFAQITAFIITPLLLVGGSTR